MSIDVSPRGGAATPLTLDVQGLVAHVRLNRPAARNALNGALIAELHSTFINLPDDVRAAVLRVFSYETGVMLKVVNGDWKVK